LFLCGCLFGGGRRVQPIRVETDRPAFRTYLAGSASAAAMDQLALDLSRRLAAEGAYGVLEVIADGTPPALLRDPLRWQSEGRVLVIHLERFEPGNIYSTRLPWIWKRVAPRTTVHAAVTLYSGSSQVLVAGQPVRGHGHGDWRQRVFSAEPPPPPTVMERRSMEKAALEDLAQQIMSEVRRYEGTAEKLLAESGGKE
jgi:hypothetical protein